MNAHQLQIIADRQQPTLHNAVREADRRDLRRLPVVDADLHLHGLGDPGEVQRYLTNPNLRRLFTRWDSLIPQPRSDRRAAGRIKITPESDPSAGALGPAIPQTGSSSQGTPRTARPSGSPHPTAATMLASMDRLGIDHAVIVHTPLLCLAQHPEVEVETELAWAFARWLVDDVLADTTRLHTLLYLPITDPDESVRFIEEFAGKPGVAGFVITALNYLPLHRNIYMKVFQALDERAQPLAVHATHNWEERPFNLMDRFLGAHALGTPFYGMVHLFNAVTSGIPERFPNIRWIWMEAGQSWATFAASRLDSEYRQRPSEAPLLTRLPSDYMRAMHFTTQPIEDALTDQQTRIFFDYMNGRHTYLYSSGYPGPDFDLPGRVWDLPYLSEEEKRAILGSNAADLFGIHPRGRASRLRSEARSENLIEEAPARRADANVSDWW
ncbi:MAG: amidohydrolase family protein [Nocardioidaceae bacterium]